MDKSILAGCIDLFKDKYTEIPVHLKDTLITKVSSKIFMAGNFVYINICDTQNLIMFYLYKN